MTRLLALVALLIGSSAARAQPTPRPADVVSWRVMAHGGQRGAEAHVMFDATVAPGWKMYALDSAVGRPLVVGLDALPAGITAGAPTQSAPTRARDAALGGEAATFAGIARVIQPVRVARTVAPGPLVVSGQVRYTVCNDAICLPPASAPFRVALAVR